MHQIFSLQNVLTSLRFQRLFHFFGWKISKSHKIYTLVSYIFLIGNGSESVIRQQVFSCSWIVIRSHKTFPFLRVINGEKYSSHKICTLMSYMSLCRSNIGSQFNWLYIFFAISLPPPDTICQLLLVLLGFVFYIRSCDQNAMYQS